MMIIRKELPFNEIRSFILLCLIFFTIGFMVKDSFCTPVKRPIIREDELVPKAVLYWPEDSFENIVLVDKGEQKVLVYKRNNLFKPEKVYKCSTGENDGPKTKKDDRRTPEGIYFFTKSFVDRELTPIYGVRAFPINYPNAVDKLEGKGGYGIWFHGTNKPLRPKDSNGCIVLDNGNIDDLANYIKLNDTPVIISSNIEMVKPEEAEREASSAIELVDKWRRAWEDKDIDEYITYYHRDFSSGYMNRKQWKAYKAMLAGKYKEIKVEIDDLQLLRNDGLLMARFRQNYSATGHNSYGIKTLYFKKNSNQWRIIREVFSKGKEKTIFAKRKKTSVEEEIKDFISSWRAAWEEKDLEGYIGCYDKRFKSRGMNLKTWKDHRNRLNEKYRELKVLISELEIVQKSETVVKVRFKQHYEADEYKDFGVKEMRLIKDGKEWKIRKEEWKPLNS